MWAKVNAASVAQENTVNLMQIDMLALNVLQTQLDNVSMQATLMIGFALGMWGGETLGPLVEDQGTHCIFKSGVHAVVACLFFSAVAVCITSCFISVVFSSYMKQAAQQAALLVATGAAVANTRRHMAFVNSSFVRAIACFMLSAVLLVWLYVGLPGRIPFALPESFDAKEIAEAEEEESVTRMYNGEFTIACIDRFDPEHNDFANRLSFTIATLNTAIILGMSAWGFMRFREVRRSYEPAVLLEWWSTYKAETAQMHDAIRRRADDKRRGAAGAEAHTYYQYAGDSDPDSTGDANGD